MITKYFIKKYKSGIISLQINTEERWIEYHRYNNHEYGFGNVGLDDEFTLKIPEDELKIPKFHLPTEIQEKDQITFYWLPYELLDINIKKD